MAFDRQFNKSNTGNVVDAEAADSVFLQRRTSQRKPLLGVFVALLLFMVIYCARPGDWIPGLSDVLWQKLSVFWHYRSRLFR